MKHLVIGSNSFLGVELCKQLVKKEKEVIGGFNKNKENLLKGIKHFPIKDLLLMDFQPDIVYIVSAYVPKNSDINIKERLEKVNVNFVKQICNKYKSSKIVFCSSVSVYRTDGMEKNEKSLLSPETLYGKSKLKGEEIVSLHEKYSIVRISSMHGVLMKSLTILPIMIEKAIFDNEITIYGEGERKQNYISVKDVASILIKSSDLKLDNDNFLAVSKNSISNIELAKIIQQIIPKIKIKFKGIDNSKSYFYNNAYTREKLELGEFSCLEKDIKEILEWKRR